MQRETISPISRCLNQHFSHYPFLSLSLAHTKIPVRRVRARALTGKKTRCEGITSIQLRRRCGFTSLVYMCDHERKPHRQRMYVFACISFASSIFSLSHSSFFFIRRRGRGIAAAAAAEECAPHHGIWVNVSSDRSLLCHGRSFAWKHRRSMNLTLAAKYIYVHKHSGAARARGVASSTLEFCPFVRTTVTL